MSLRVRIVTTSRADYGIYRPVAHRLREDPRFDVAFLVSGTHLAESFGRTVSSIEEDGFPIAARIPAHTEGDTPEAIAAAMARTVAGFGETFAASPIDVLLVLGDRYEMAAATLAAVPFGFIIAHLHGGEVTRGAFDESFRHAITKLSHLHFASAPEHARRIVQLGEEPWRVTVTGAPGLDNLAKTPLLSREELRERGIALPEEFLLATLHPTTLEPDRAASHVAAFLGALERIGIPVVFTMPNADPGNRVLRRAIEEFVKVHTPSVALESVGTRAYFSLMSRARAMVGNSSSGIIEAASFRLPVVNIGSRQQGRLRGRNVIDVQAEQADIEAGLRRALDPAFRATLRDLRNPYGDGRASDAIVEVLARLSPRDPRIIVKQFHDLPEVRHGD